MIISVNWLKKFTNIEGSVDELANLIGSRLVEIEEVVDINAKYAGVVIAKVVECVALEDSDHLNITKIDDGGVVDGVERDDNGLVQVVCGAPNAREGLTVAWLPPKSTVPETFGDSEPFVLDARKLRGVVSNGMLASAKELDLWDDHTGIVELDSSLAAGSSFADTFELNDCLLDIENKSLTHRPDTFGIIGFAREVAGIQCIKFETPTELEIDGAQLPPRDGDEQTPSVTIDNPDMAARYQAVVLGDFDNPNGSLPFTDLTYLSRVGVKSHSAIVDATNYAMMLTGQPLHAFDYDKLLALNDGKIDIRVRGGRDGEKLVLLDGREIELDPTDIVIANGDVAVALAGAMGGQSTEIDESTSRIMLESASFNLYNLRTTQMRHGVFSEAVTRFTKGQPAELTSPVLTKVVNMLVQAVGAKRLSDVADAYPTKQPEATVRVVQQVLNQTLGSDFGMSQIVNTLSNVGFEVDVEEGYVIVAKAPYWRTDIHMPEDIIEEVGRLNGFDNIPPVLATRTFKPVSPSAFDEFRYEVRSRLARAGANEVLSYSFVHGDTLSKAGQNVEHAFKIVNSISPDLQYYRLSLTPNLLGLAHPNLKAGYADFAIFEFNKVHSKLFGNDPDDTPNERYMLAGLVNRKSTTSPYYDAKRLSDYLLSSLNLTVDYVAFDDDSTLDEFAPFDKRRSALVVDSESKEILGVVGEYTRAASKSFKLGAVAGFEFYADKLYEAHATSKASYTPLSKYPGTERDICFKVSVDCSYARLVDCVDSVLGEIDIRTSIGAVDIYQAEGASTKNITIRIKFVSDDHTLTSDEVAEIVDKITSTTKSDLGAEII